MSGWKRYSALMLLHELNKPLTINMNKLFKVERSGSSRKTLHPEGQINRCGFYTFKQSIFKSQFVAAINDTLRRWCNVKQQRKNNIVCLNTPILAKKISDSNLTEFKLISRSFESYFSISLFFYRCVRHRNFYSKIDFV